VRRPLPEGLAELISGAIVKDNRPVNLDFTTFKLPLPAITSILHRISGAVLFVGVALLLYLLDMSLESAEGFATVADWLSMPLGKLLTWLVVSALAYHLIAGLKHLLMDLGIGETLAGGVLGAKLVIALSAAAIIAAGVWIW
jgi:succinate dehydrogenase / fumarate reductase cytochrome b subunit